MLRWREIAAKYSTLWNVTVWEASSHFIDQILSLKTVTANSVLITLTCMGAVCMLFIPSPCSVICASLAIASISLGMFNYLHNLNIQYITTYLTYSTLLQYYSIFLVKYLPYYNTVHYYRTTVYF